MIPCLGTKFGDGNDDGVEQTGQKSLVNVTDRYRNVNEIDRQRSMRQREVKKKGRGVSSKIRRKLRLLGKNSESTYFSRLKQIMGSTQEGSLTSVNGNQVNCRDFHVFIKGY